MIPPPNVHSLAWISYPSHVSLVPRPRSDSNGRGFTMEAPKKMSLLCEGLLAGLAGVDGSWY